MRDRRLGQTALDWLVRIMRLTFVLPLMAFWAGFALTMLIATALAWYGAALLVLSLL